MKDKIDRIRTALDELELELPSAEDDRVLREFSAFELPEIVTDIVDYLIPLLTTYQAAFYWYMFRHSALGTGKQYVRVSTKRLRKGVVLSSSGHSRDVSYEAVQKSLADLASLGAIRKEGEPNREGTLYKVLIPEEIEPCRQAMQARRVKEGKPVDIETEVDFYNVRENRHKIFERDGYKCAYCGKQLTRFTATLDHIKPLSSGGDNSYDNVITAFLACNSKKTGKPLGDFLADRERLGRR